MFPIEAFSFVGIANGMQDGVDPRVMQAHQQIGGLAVERQITARAAFKDERAEMLRDQALTVSGLLSKPNMAGLAPKCISELKIARLGWPSTDFVPTNTAWRKPANELINAAL